MSPLRYYTQMQAKIKNEISSNDEIELIMQ